MNSNFREVRREGWEALGGNWPGSILRDEKTKFRGATGQGRTAVGYRERIGPPRLERKRDLGKAQGSGRAAGSGSCPCGEGGAAGKEQHLRGLKAREGWSRSPSA